MLVVVYGNPTRSQNGQDGTKIDVVILSSCSQPYLRDSMRKFFFSERPDGRLHETPPLLICLIYNPENNILGWVSLHEIPCVDYIKFYFPRDLFVGREFIVCLCHPIMSEQFTHARETCQAHIHCASAARCLEDKPSCARLAFFGSSCLLLLV